MLVLQDMLDLSKRRIAGLGDGSAGKNICASVRAWAHIPSTSVKNPACVAVTAVPQGSGDRGIAEATGIHDRTVSAGPWPPEHPGISRYIVKCLHHIAHTHRVAMFHVLCSSVSHTIRGIHRAIIRIHLIWLQKPISSTLGYIQNVHKW